jgi:iron complex transport system substrate-binding protein
MRKTRRLLAIVLCAVFLLGVLSGCGSQQQSSEPTVTEKTIVDMADVEVKVPGEVKTVVNLWPSSNEL